MRKISMFAAALIMVGLGAWAAVPATPRLAASASAQVDPLRMMTDTKNLPSAHYVDYTFVFN
jgi:hypothetical protein